MTLQTEVSKVVYAGLIGETIFAYNFRVDDKDDMEVYLAGVLIDDNAWSIDGLGNPLGGNVTLNDPLLSNVTVTLLRVVDATQQIDYQPFDAFPSETHELALDRLTMMVQQLDEQVDRAYKAPVDSAPGEDFSFPPYDPGKLLGWSETEPNQIENSEQTFADFEEQADIAAAAAVSALASAELAEDWAAEQEDIPVEGQLFSARHYAIKALKARSGLNLISIISGDDLCPKPGDDPPSVCQVPDHRNPGERFPNRENLPGDYFIISAPGDMNLKDPDDPIGPEVVTAVEISDYIIFLPDLLDGDQVPIIGEGWYRQGGLTGEGVSAALVSFDDTTTDVKGNNVQAWNETADATMFQNRLSGYLYNGTTEDFSGDLNALFVNGMRHFTVANVTNQPDDMTDGLGWIQNITSLNILNGLQIIYGRTGNANKVWMRLYEIAVFAPWVLVVDGSITQIKDDITAAQGSADAAQGSADAAQGSADAAQSTANAAKPELDFLRVGDRLDIFNVRTS